MSKISFTVSARTARLIGAQNFSNAEGAIVELVKNAYDADAKKCIVFFDNRYATLPTSLSADEYQSFKDFDLVPEYYKKNGIGYRLDLGLNKPQSLDDAEKNAATKKLDADRNRLREFFNLKTKLYIIDDGEGMTDDIIKSYWMVIGTDNKQEDIYTRNGRIKTGAKGIGRFALDRLGTQAEMTTKPSREKYPKIDLRTGFLWNVNWNDFDGNGKTIGDVKANLIDVRPINFTAEVEKVVPKKHLSQNRIRTTDFEHGTIIQIFGLKENWDEFYVDKVFSSLEVLIPPKEGRKFDVYLFSAASPEKYGQVQPSLCDDYDYKLTAHVDSEGKAAISIFRNEYDVSKLTAEFFERPNLAGDRYRKKYFGKEPVIYDRTLAELLPGFKEKDEKNVLGSIGAFDFAFYFMKGQTTKKDMERFCYKEFNSSARKFWLDEFGGIKLFRDDFRVRPYGESKGNAFDWLDLGVRAASSPAGIGKKSGGYKVRPNNVAGIINISRINNIRLDDKSSREGIQENETFWVFKHIIIKLIEEFENDRTYIGQELATYYEEKNQNRVTEEAAADILAKVKQTAKSKKPEEAKSEDEKDKEILARYVILKQDEIEELKNEQHLLKILASNALTISSFTHELRSIESSLVGRVEEAEKQFKTVVDLKRCNALPDYLNPFVLLGDIKNDDIKLKEWLGYSLGTLKKDKRRRKNVDLIEYFERFEKSWKNAFDNRGIGFKAKLPKVDALNLKVFEIDLDCIFNNLVTNTFEAFVRKDAPVERKINIHVQIVDADILITYHDSGPGLSKDIVEPNRIFEPHFTTKKDIHTGEDVGTGLGMWLVKSFVEDNKGTVELLPERPGFGLKIHLPNKIKVKST